jgi:rare lipoprotein A
MSNRFTFSTCSLLLVGVLIALPAAAESRNDKNAVLLPYVAVGGETEGWHFQTLLALGNPLSSANSGTIEFFGNDGQPLDVFLNHSTELAAQSSWTVSPQQSKLLILTHPGNTFKAGWLRLETSAKSPIDVTAIVQLYNGENLVGQAGIVSGRDSETLASARMIAYTVGNPLWPVQNPGAAPLTRIIGSVGRTEVRAPRLQLAAYAVTSPSSPSHSQRVRREALAPRYIEIGTASWYGLQGRRAANGRIFDQEKLTAAHPTLPFGTRARVTNLRNHRSVIVRISDRGPFVANRTVDLSMAAARRLGMMKSGTALVRLETLPPVSQNAPKSKGSVS